MSEKHEDGGPAFPVEMVNTTGRNITLNGKVLAPEMSVQFQGMSLRDYFAAKAMHGLLVNTVKVNDNKPPHPESVELARSYADASYLFADAMLKARSES